MTRKKHAYNACKLTRKKRFIILVRVAPLDDAKQLQMYDIKQPCCDQCQF